MKLSFSPVLYRDMELDSPSASYQISKLSITDIEVYQRMLKDKIRLGINDVSPIGKERYLNYQSLLSTLSVEKERRVMNLLRDHNK